MVQVKDKPIQLVGEPWVNPDFITVAKKIDFSAAHFLPNYEGKCRNLHGHTWTVEIAVKGPVLLESGMVVDFTWLSSALKSITYMLDHHLINDKIPNPTAENIAFWVRDKFRNEWLQGPDSSIQLRWVKVWESLDSMAMWERD